MPWKKAFDEADVIDKIMHVFWEKGYEATSISDLTDATGIQRGSLYNAFEGKKELFIKALLKYDVEQRSAMLKQLESMDDPLEAFSILFDMLVQQSIDDKIKKGCFLVNTLLYCFQYDEQIQKIVTESVTDFEKFFVRLIKRGQKLGKIPSTVSPRRTSQALVSMVIGIRVLARGAFDIDTLKHIVKEAKRLIS